MRWLCRNINQRLRLRLPESRYWLQRPSNNRRYYLKALTSTGGWLRKPFNRGFQHARGLINNSARRAMTLLAETAVVPPPVLARTYGVLLRANIRLTAPTSLSGKLLPAFVLDITGRRGAAV